MARFKYSLFCYLFSFGITVSVGKPNIVVIIADDLGWNDVGFHGSNEMPTPNIDALAYNGIILNRHYVLPTCTPSRAALMTGKYPIKTGLQGDPGAFTQPWALPLKEKILPQYLKDFGYKTHLVGKWHLGFLNTAYTPTKRGFDTHFGYYNGWIRYNDSVTTSQSFAGIDARRNLKPAGYEFVGQYATDVFTKEAVNIIRNHDSKNPLFLEVSHVAPHAIKKNILQVRDENKNDADFKNIVNLERRRLAGVLQALDESVGKIIEALKEANLLENSVVLFISDNGGATEDNEWHFRNSASNWPLRGMKTSLHEGGVRGAAAIWSPLFSRKNYVSNELFHITDWVPTFVTAAGGDSKFPNIDGINQWDVLTGNQLKTDRREVLVNIDYERGISAIIQENWKLVKSNETYQPSYTDYYAGESDRTEIPSYAWELVLNSATNHLIGNKEKNLGSKFLTIRSQAKLDSECQSRISSTPNFDDIKCLGFCLFDLENDPCESLNLVHLRSDIVTKLNTRLQYYESVTVPQQRLNNDENANPNRWEGYWSPWLDESDDSISSTIAENLLIFGIAFVICKKIISSFQHVIIDSN